MENRTDEWRIEQFNRNRSIEEQVSTIEEMKKKVEEIFSEDKYIYERNPDTGQLYRRNMGDYENRIPVDDDLNPYSEQLELFKQRGI